MTTERLVIKIFLFVYHCFSIANAFCLFSHIHPHSTCHNMHKMFSIGCRNDWCLSMTMARTIFTLQFIQLNSGHGPWVERKGKKKILEKLLVCILQCFAKD